MDVHPAGFEFDFEDLKATEGYNPPDDFLIRVLPLHAGGVLPGGQKTRKRLWYEYPSPFNKTRDLQLQKETERKLQLEEEDLWRSLEERERQRQQLELDLHRRRVAERERQRLDRQYVMESLRQRQYEIRCMQNERRLEERYRVGSDQQPYLMAIQANATLEHERRLVEKQYLQVQRQDQEESQRDLVESQAPVQLQREDLNQRRPVEWKQDQDDLNFDEIWANSSTGDCWGLVDETATHSSSPPPARDAHDEHQFHVEEHRVHVKMCEYDDANMHRYNLFNCEANTKRLILPFDLKIPYYLYAGRCNLKLEGYELRYADFFPSFTRWNYTWVRPTTYEGDCQFVDFFTKIMSEVEYFHTKDRVLAKAIAVANKGFQKILYFQIELAVEDCMMILEEKERFEQRCNLYGYIASELHFEKKKYESVLEHIMNGHGGFRYELTELGSHDNEDDALEMHEFVHHLVGSAPIELPSTAMADDVYKKWVSRQVNLQFKPCFHLYENFLVEKINMAQDLDLIPED